jgi:hypothetical protein
MEPGKKKQRKARELTTLGMILTRKGGPMKDKRRKRCDRRTDQRSAIEEHI